MRCVMTFSRGVIAVVLFTGLLSGIAMGMGATPRSPQISIEGQEANLSPAMLGIGSVFMKIVNSGNGSDNLVLAKVSVPNAVVELHDVKDGKMAKIEKIFIPSGSAVELKPGGLHIMIFKLPKDIQEGQEFTLHLVFEKSGEKTVPIKFTGPSGAHMHHNH